MEGKRRKREKWGCEKWAKKGWRKKEKERRGREDPKNHSCSNLEARN